MNKEKSKPTGYSKTVPIPSSKGGWNPNPTGPKPKLKPKGQAGQSPKIR